MAKNSGNRFLKMNTRKKYLTVAILSVFVLVTAQIVRRLKVQIEDVPVVVSFDRSLSTVEASEYRRKGFYIPEPPVIVDSVKYDEAKDKKIAITDIKEIRRKVAWCRWSMNSVKAISIDGTNVVRVFVENSKYISLYFEKNGGSWRYTEELGQR